MVGDYAYYENIEDCEQSTQLDYETPKEYLERCRNNNPFYY